MAKRLSNDELAENVRSRVRRNCAIYRDRLSRSGQRQTLVWLPEPIRARLDELSETRNQSLSAVTAELLTAALTPAIPEPTTHTLTTAERNERIKALHLQGVSGREIARRLGIGKSTVQGVVKRMEATI